MLWSVFLLIGLIVAVQLQSHAATSSFGSLSRKTASDVDERGAHEVIRIVAAELFSMSVAERTALMSDNGYTVTVAAPLQFRLVNIDRLPDLYESRPSEIRQAGIAPEQVATIREDMRSTGLEGLRYATLHQTLARTGITDRLAEEFTQRRTSGADANNPGLRTIRITVERTTNP